MTLRELVWMVEARNWGAPTDGASFARAPMTREAFAAMKGTFRRFSKLKARRPKAPAGKNAAEEGAQPCDGS